MHGGGCQVEAELSERSAYQVEAVVSEICAVRKECLGRIAVDTRVKVNSSLLSRPTCQADEAKKRHVVRPVHFGLGQCHKDRDLI